MHDSTISMVTHASTGGLFVSIHGVLEKGGNISHRYIIVFYETLVNEEYLHFRVYATRTQIST